MTQAYYSVVNRLQQRPLKMEALAQHEQDGGGLIFLKYGVWLQTLWPTKSPIAEGSHYKRENNF